MTCSRCHAHWCWICLYCRDNYTLFQGHVCRPHGALFRNGVEGFFLIALPLVVLFVKFLQLVVNIFCWPLTYFLSWSSCPHVPPSCLSTIFSFVKFCIFGLVSLLWYPLARCISLESRLLVELISSTSVLLVTYGGIQMWLWFSALVDVILLSGVSLINLLVPLIFPWIISRYCAHFFLCLAILALINKKLERPLTSWGWTGAALIVELWLSYYFPPFHFTLPQLHLALCVAVAFVALWFRKSRMFLSPSRYLMNRRICKVMVSIGVVTESFLLLYSVFLFARSSLDKNLIEDLATFAEVTLL